MLNFIKDKKEFIQKVTPKYILLNENYFSEFIMNEEIGEVTMCSDGIYATYKGIIEVDYIPVIIDNSIITYKVIYDDQ